MTGSRADSRHRARRVGVQRGSAGCVQGSELVFGTLRKLSAPSVYPACDTMLNQPCRRDAFSASDPSGELG